MSDRKIVLVTGATGQQGGAVARELLSAGGYRVRVMTRNPESEAARALAGLGAEATPGDFDDVDSLKRALDGAWGVFSVQNTWEAGVEKEEVQGKRLAETAKKAGVRHFVYSSVGSADMKTGIPHFDNKWRIEEVVRSLEFPSHVIIRPVFFMDNFLSPWFKPAIEKGKLAVGIEPDTVLQMIAVIGKYGLWTFEEHENLNGRAVDIAGDARTMPATAKVLGDALGKTVEFERIPIEEVRKSSEEFATMYEWFDRVGYHAEIERIAGESGIRPTTLEQWAARADWS
jgi:uncharacterized protein YbjT (DUF2867 family)